MTKQQRIVRLRKKRDELWKDFCRMPRRESFSGLNTAEQLEKVQQQLDGLEWPKRSKRYYPKISIEAF